MGKGGHLIIGLETRTTLDTAITDEHYSIRHPRAFCALQHCVTLSNRHIHTHIHVYLRIATVCNTLADTCTVRIRDEASIIHEQCIVSISNVLLVLRLVLKGSYSWLAGTPSKSTIVRPPNLPNCCLSKQRVTVVYLCE